MSRFAGVGMAAFALAALVGCAPPDAATKSPSLATDDDVRAMRAAGKTRSEALAAGDVEKFLSVYQEDTVLVPPHSAEIVGKSHARERLVEALKEVAIEPATDSREYEILGPAWIAERGRFSWNVTPKEKGEPYQDSGNFMILWHKAQDGSWKIAWEMWTSSRPLVEPKAN
jgi:uncharacterized protein (TIGR02246 family)